MDIVMVKDIFELCILDFDDLKKDFVDKKMKLDKLYPVKNKNDYQDIDIVKVVNYNVNKDNDNLEKENDYYIEEHDN